MADANALPLPPPEPGPQPRRRFASLAPLSALLALFALAAAVRAWLAFDPSLGHESDLSFFSSWTRQLTQHGLSGFHEAEDFCDYPPLMLLLFRTIGALVAWLNGGSLHEHTLRVALKLPACLADLALGLLIAREAARCAGRRSALPAAALYLLNPLTIYNSAYWGQVDSIYALFAFAALAAAGGTRWVVAGFLIATALLTKFQAVAFLPLIILEAYRRQRWIGVGRGMIGAALAAALILAPFIAAGALRETLRRSYVHVIGQYNDLTRSAYNLWTLAGPPQAADTAIPAPLVRLVAGGRIVREAFPPRNDVCQRIEWDLNAVRGQRAHLEIVDGDNGTAYAWLGLTRIEPPVVSIDAFTAGDRRQRQLRSLAAILRTTAPVGLRDRLAAYLPAPPAPVGKPKPAPETEALIQRRIAAFGKAMPDASKGELVFKASCAVCHQLKGEGGLIGPQLDGIGNRGAARLIEDILDPNRNVDAHFHLHQMRLRDGSVATGFVRGEVGQVAILVDAAGTELRIAKGDIVEDNELPQSLMPPIFGSALGERDFFDLLGFLIRC